MKHDPTEARAPRRNWITVAGMAVLLWLAWRILSLGIADHLAAVSPASALRWRADHDQALLQAALSSMPDAPVAAARFARRALRSNPLQGIAYRVLAMQAGAGTVAAADLYAIAARRAPRDVPSLAWLADRALARADPADALEQFDQILRVEPGALAFVSPALQFIVGQPAARGALAEVLAAHPPWRTAALVALARDAPDPAALSALFVRLRTDDIALSGREIGVWLERLIREREWGAAYLAWAAQLPPARREGIGNVYNGGFEWAPTNIGFDWRLHPMKDAHAARARVDGASGNAALRVDFHQQHAPFEHVEQLLALPPGHYELAGRARLERLRASHGVAWSLACAEGGLPFARTRAFAGDQGWKPFAVEFEVPAVGCGAQWLRLRNEGRTPAARAIDGSIWFDDLRIRGLAMRGDDQDE